MNKLQNIKIKGKIVLLRADLDISDGGDFRLEAGIPTIKYLLENDCKTVIIGHRGRPNGNYDVALSLRSIFEKLKKYFPKKNADDFKFCADISKDSVLKIISDMRAGNILMLENLRFYSGEEANSADFAQKLASFADIFVNDAFAVCHRKHASIVGIPNLLPSCAGIRLEKEIRILSDAMNAPKHPAVAIIGGAKIETKVPVISELAKIYDYILVGGKIGLSFRHPEEYSTIGEDDEGSREIQERMKNVLFPVDYVGENKFDIGEKTIENFKEIIKSAETIIWNGPMGKFEDREFIHGTKEIAYAIIESQSNSIVGGGDTIAAINNLEIDVDNFGWVSTGGGAMLKMMSGEKLAGIEALNSHNT